MRLTRVLSQQHIGNMFKRHWQVQGKRTPLPTSALSILLEKGIPVIDAVDYAMPKPPIIPVPIQTNYYEPEKPLDENHPLYKSKECHTFGDSNVLVEGVAQAQNLTKTLITEKLPAKLQELADSVEVSPDTDLYMKNAIINAHLFDAEQVKLPIKKLPERPAYVLPRTYGISLQRKNRLITSKILLECQNLAGPSYLLNRFVINNARFVVPLEKDDLLYQFDLNAETAIMSTDPLALENKTDSECFKNQSIPDLFPLACNISVPTTHFYRLKNIYPTNKNNPFLNPHTIFEHYTAEDVKHLFETPVTADQFQARSLLKGFAVAAARAKKLYGDDVKDLPKPISVQTIQISHNEFRFCVYQLNTLELNGVKGVKNFWYNMAPIKLYDDCTYLESRPRLNGYNPEVFKLVYAFYKNQ